MLGGRKNPGRWSGKMNEYSYPSKNWKRAQGSGLWGTKGGQGTDIPKLPCGFERNFIRGLTKAASVVLR